MTKPISKNQIKYIRSLKDKKFRNLNHTFVAEGEKLISDLAQKVKCQLLATLPEVDCSTMNTEKKVTATVEELKRASSLKTAPRAIAVFYQNRIDIDKLDFNNRLTLILDGVQDPGNLGTIVRICSWFAIKQIVCSPDCADIYNPKTVQATMGALSDVDVIYTDLRVFLKQHSTMPIYGTFMDGENIYDAELSKNGFLVMGSEGQGISYEVQQLINRRICIPPYAEGEREDSHAESLNVAVATAIVCSEFRRRK